MQQICDLASKYVSGWNFYNNNADWSDVYGHGTYVAGTVGACSNNGLGVASIAWNCKIMPLRISDASGYGYISTMASALTWAADHGARVANISYQVSSDSAIVNAAKYFQSKGGVVTISAGNDSMLHTNADNPYALTVSAPTSADTLASFSNYGSDVNVCAPGSGIYTTAKGGTYASVSGTSFAAPATAGVAALVISANPSLTGAQVQNIIKKSVDDLGTAGWDNTYAWGRINAACAVAMAVNPNSYVDTTAPSVGFLSPGNGTNVSGTTSVQMTASDTAGIASISLRLDGVQIASYSSTSAAWSWNILNAVNGMHTLNIVATDVSGNSASTSISVNVYNAPDTTVPTVTITLPTGGKLGNSLSVSANASDNRGVVRVELWADGKLAQSDTSAPWTLSLNTRKWAAHTRSNA